jgi:hypothetical protein
MKRRSFLMTGAGAGVAASAGAGVAASAGAAAPSAPPAGAETSSLGAAIDFRYSPLSYQTAYCYPDDPFKSLIGERGELRYGNPGRGKPADYFSTVIEFSMLGMEPDKVVRQSLETPATPVIHSRISRPDADLNVTVFATNETGEGRVDNVIIEITPTVANRIHATPLVNIRTRTKLVLRRQEALSVVHPEGDPTHPLLIATGAFNLRDQGACYQLVAPVAEEASAEHPLRRFIRIPQQNQEVDRIAAGLAAPAGLLATTRGFWRDWRPFGGEVAWKLNGPYHDFLTACARNIQQAREVVNGKTTFQVGPTCYRGLWVVDGHFLLESARYLGYDAEAQKGLETTWTFQDESGGVFAGGGREHWKDTGIAMFSLVRQAELAQNWDFFKQMKPQVLRGVAFLQLLRDKARAEGSANGKYGLLARGMGDGGIGGIRSEFTNTIWVLAGLKAVIDAAARLRLDGYEPVAALHNELRAAFFASAKQEMRAHAAGFEFLPMLMKEDALWNDPDEWKRPRIQAGQWAMAHAIYPGLVFDKDDPMVKGFVRLMQAVTQEDVPAETGWLPHQGLWTYNAPFVSHAYLWAGEPDWARLTFHGFLNHATPLYCWREEQPLRNALVSGYVGDMPHNWASAECILYLRHMLALEDGNDLRLLAAFGDPEFDAARPYSIANSPTRFGRIGMELTPEGRGWRLEFQRSAGASARAPGRVLLPLHAGSRPGEVEVRGAATRSAGSNAVAVDPTANNWTAVWRT